MLFFINAKLWLAKARLFVAFGLYNPQHDTKDRLKQVKFYCLVVNVVYVTQDLRHLEIITEVLFMLFPAASYEFKWAMTALRIYS